MAHLAPLAGLSGASQVPPLHPVLTTMTTATGLIYVTVRRVSRIYAPPAKLKESHGKTCRILMEIIVLCLFCPGLK